MNDELKSGQPIEKDRDRVTIYDTQTGETSIVMATMLPQQLRKTRPDGSTVFTTNYPGIEPKRGTLKCLLHKDDPSREYYDSLGLAVCRKSNLTSKFQVGRHMQKRHKIEWQTIEQDKRERIEAKEMVNKEEDRALQRLILKSALRNDNKPVGEPTEDPCAIEIEETGRGLLDGEYNCTKCNKIHRGTSALGKRHLKYKECV